MPATLEERYNTHVEARKNYDEKVKVAQAEYDELWATLNDEISDAHRRRKQLTSAFDAACDEAKAEYKEATGVDPDPF